MKLTRRPSATPPSCPDPERGLNRVYIATSVPIPPAAISASLPPAAVPLTRVSEPLLKKALKDWHASDQPRERLMASGAEALASSELLAILLRSGTKRHSAIDVARDLLQRCGGQLRQLSRLDHKALAGHHGMGPVKAVTLCAALELGRRVATEVDEEAPQILTAARAYDIIAPLIRDLPHEECWVLLLNSASKLIGKERISSGGLDGTLVDVRSVMACALRHGAASLILCHNHPSQTAAPSEPDREITRRLRAAGEVMGIRLGDHVIVAGQRYYSFRDAGELG